MRRAWPACSHAGGAGLPNGGRRRSCAAKYGAAVQHREVMLHESAEFNAIFNQVNYLNNLLGTPWHSHAGGILLQHGMVHNGLHI